MLFFGLGNTRISTWILPKKKKEKYFNDERKKDMKSNEETEMFYENVWTKRKSMNSIVPKNSIIFHRLSCPIEWRTSFHITHITCVCIDMRIEIWWEIDDRPWFRTEIWFIVLRWNHALSAIYSSHVSTINAMLIINRMYKSIIKHYFFFWFSAISMTTIIAFYLYSLFFCSVSFTLSNVLTQSIYELMVLNLFEWFGSKFWNDCRNISTRHLVMHWINIYINLFSFKVGREWKRLTESALAQKWLVWYRKWARPVQSTYHAQTSNALMQNWLELVFFRCFCLAIW